MGYDDILKDIGEFGLYQRWVYVFVFFISFPHLFNALGYVFWAARTDHWCHVDKPQHMENVSEQLWKNFTIPLKKPVQEMDGMLAYDSCTRYAYTDNMTRVTSESQDVYVLFSDWANYTEDLTELKPCESWDYDTSQYVSTIVSKFSLVCHRQWLISTTQSFYMVGRIVGAVTFGFLSDRFGRRPVILLSLLFEVTSSIAITFAPNVQTFILLRTLCAACTSGSYLTAYIFVMEIVGPSWRVFVGITMSLGWGSCYMLLPLIAYFIRDGAKLMLALSVPCCALVVLYWVLPESPRWLLVRERDAEAMSLIRRIASVNNKTLPEGYRVMIDTVTIKNKAGTSSFSEILKCFFLWKMALVLCFMWFTSTGVYYGLSLNSANLAGNDYLNVFIAGAVEIPAYLLCRVMCVHFGRQWPLSAMYLLTGLSLFSIIWIPPANYIGTVIMVSVGKFLVTCTVGMIYIYTTELFPTSMRSLILGLSNMAARTGGSLAPFAADLGAFFPAAPFMIFTSLAVVSSIVVLTLPETKGICLPQTLHDGKILSQQPNAFSRCFRKYGIGQKGKERA